MWCVLFLGTMKLTDWTTQLKSYKNQIIAGSLWPVYFGFPLYFDVYKSRTIISPFSKRWMICTTFNNLWLRCRMYFNYAEWFVLRWMICTNMSKLYLQRWMCFDYVERFAVLLNDLDGSVKPSPGKHHPENCLGIFSTMKIPTINIAP